MKIRYHISVVQSIFRALVSYPGSGNTWLRNLIEMMTGLITADERESVVNTEYAGPGKYLAFAAKFNQKYFTGTALLVKSHHRDYHFYRKPLYRESLTWLLDDISFFHGQGILLIRNPFHAIR